MAGPLREARPFLLPQPATIGSPLGPAAGLGEDRQGDSFRRKGSAAFNVAEVRSAAPAERICYGASLAGSLKFTETEGACRSSNILLFASRNTILPVS